MKYLLDNCKLKRKFILRTNEIFASLIKTLGFPGHPPGGDF